MFSGFILELKLEFSKYFTRIVYSGKIETKPSLILERAILVSLLYRTGKQVLLKKVFILGAYNINLVKINLIYLIKGNILIILYTISINRLEIKSSSLINTRANSYTFINIKLT